MRFELSRPRSSLLTVVVALLCLVGAIPLALFGLRVTAYNRERIRSQQQVSQLVTAEGVAREVALFVAARRSEVQSFARGLEPAFALREPSAIMDVVQEQRLLNRYIESSGDLLKLILAAPASSDEAGGLDVVVAERRGGDLSYAAAEERLVTTLLQRAFEGQTTVETETSGAPLLIVVCPVGVGGRVQAVLAGLVGLDPVGSMLTARSERRYLIYLTDAEGRRILACSQGEEARPQLTESDLVHAFRANRGTRTMSFQVRDHGRLQDMLGAYAEVPQTGWGVFVEVDAATAYFDVRRMSETTVIWSVLSMLLAVVVGVLFARRLVQPIRELADGALRLARGDFSVRIRARSQNELGILALTFNHMADEVGELVEKLQAAARENKELFLGTIRSLAEAIDEKDPYTRGHSERVTRYAVACARALGLDETEVEKVQIGALLHDIGKIGIDERILNKPTELTEEEFEAMKQHPEKGVHILGHLQRLAPMIPAMQFHHERVNGTGYPKGLRGAEIPLAAQIVSVADTFDAMTTERPYQRAMEPDEVLGKLQGWVGERFRGDVVEAFTRAWQAGLVEPRRRSPEPAEKESVSGGVAEGPPR